MAKNFSFEDYFYNLDKNGINLSPQCSIHNNDKESCEKDLNCKYYTLY